MRICVNSLGLLNVLYILRHFLFHPFSPCTPICFLSQFCFRAILSESMFHSALVILFLHPWQYATVLLGSRTKWYRTKWYGQNGMDKMVYGRNGIGQNGTDKMVRTKWYG